MVENNLVSSKNNNNKFWCYYLSLDLCFKKGQKKILSNIQSGLFKDLKKLSGQREIPHKGKPSSKGGCEQRFTSRDESHLVENIESNQE